MNKLATQLLVVGAGPAGLAAAAAADDKYRVAILDDNPMTGGQIWRAELGKLRSANAARLVTAINEKDIAFVGGAEVHSVIGKDRVAAETSDGRLEIEFERIVIATGARELFLPFPGWTLPGVFGAGGSQALVKGGFDVGGKRVVIAGTGPLLLPVAQYFKRKGAIVVAIAEQASRSDLGRFAVRLLASPAKLRQAAKLRAALFGVPYLTGCWVTQATGGGRLQCVTLTRKGKSWPVDCDLLAYGFHLVPNVELAELFGCEIEYGSVVVDQQQQTTVEGVYCAGEPTGIAGVDAALIEGEIAGLAATGLGEKTRQLVRKRDRARKFGKAMDRAFALNVELKRLADAGTIVCRCEDVEYGRLSSFTNFREAKLQTRCGMGPCQGRICGAATQFIFGWEPPSVRPPIFPVKMKNL